MTLIVFLILWSFAKQGERLMSHMSKSEIEERLKVVKQHANIIYILAKSFGSLANVLGSPRIRKSAAQLEKMLWELVDKARSLQLKLDLIEDRCELWKKAPLRALSICINFVLYIFWLICVHIN